MKPKIKVQFTVNFELTEGEMKALDALAGYGTKEFLDCFYKHMGEAYLKPFESDLINLFEKVKQLREPINTVNEARKKIGI